MGVETELKLEIRKLLKNPRITVIATADNVDDYYPTRKEAVKRVIKNVGYVQIDENTGFRRANTDSFAKVFIRV